MPNLNITPKKIVINISIIIAITLIAIGTISILKNTTKKDIAVIKPESAKNIIASAAAQTKISSLSAKLYGQQANSSATTGYKSSDYDYSVDIPTNNSVLFYAISESQENDTVSVRAQVNEFMYQNGLKKVDTDNKPVDESSYDTIFDGEKAICQLTDSMPPNTKGTTSFHIITCIDVSQVNQEYATVEKLLEIYKKNNQINEFTKVSRYITSEDKVSYSILTIKTTGKSLRLLFASIDNNWEYLGNLSDSDPKYSSEKYNITPELQAKISDPKYNGFIVKEIH